MLRIKIQKLDPNDQLGMDVKHRLGRLVVLAIRRGGAIDRGNLLAKQQGLPVMQVNDVIVEVLLKDALKSSLFIAILSVFNICWLIYCRC